MELLRKIFVLNNVCMSICQFDRAKSIKKNVTMTFYNENEQLYIEKDTSGVRLGTSVLQVRYVMWYPRNEAPYNTTLWPIALSSKSLKSMETHYSTIERQTPGILHGLEKFHHYCFS